MSAGIGGTKGNPESTSARPYKKNTSNHPPLTLCVQTPRQRPLPVPLRILLLLRLLLLRLLLQNPIRPPGNRRLREEWLD